MADQPDPRQTLLAAITRALAHVAEPRAEQVAALDALFWAEYRAAGAPFGDTEAGRLQYFRVVGQATRDYWKAMAFTPRLPEGELHD